jgi:hypothetical protein
MDRGMSPGGDGYDGWYGEWMVGELVNWVIFLISSWWLMMIIHDELLFMIYCSFYLFGMITSEILGDGLVILFWRFMKFHDYIIGLYIWRAPSWSNRDLREEFVIGDGSPYLAEPPGNSKW